MTESSDHGSSAEPRLSLRLYVAGDAPNSAAAVANLRLALAQHCLTHAQLEIVDVLRDPVRGMRDGVLVTPTLLRLVPLPERRVVGNLRERAVLLGMLLPAGEHRE